MFDMEERIMADRKEFEGFKSEFGDATAKYPMQLEDPERLDLAIVYSGIRHNRDAQVAAERLARNYLRINDFDSARKVLDKMGYTPKQIIRDLENLYTFTGSDEYMEMKNTYMENVAADMRKEQKRIRKELEKGMESRKYNLWIHYVNGLRDVQRAQEELKSELGKRKRYLRLVSGKEYLSSNGEWFNEIERLGKEISGGRDAGLDEDSPAGARGTGLRSPVCISCFDGYAARTHHMDAALYSRQYQGHQGLRQEMPNWNAQDVSGRSTHRRSLRSPAL